VDGGFFEKFRTATSDLDRIRLLDETYRSAKPRTKEHLTKGIERGAAIGGKVKEPNQYICQICGGQPFKTRTGHMYAEAHHIIPLHKMEPGSMASQNVICVCPNCHRKMHYADVKLISVDQQNVTSNIDGRDICVKRNRL